MRSLVTIFALALLVACGSENSSNALEEAKMISSPTPDMVDEFEIDEMDVVKISDVLPTMYYTIREDSMRCKGGYGSANYSGKETQKLITPEGKYIATVCKRFAMALLMEGSGILKNRGQGEIALNYGGKVRGQHRYHRLNRCKLGEGVQKDLCLLPYHTIAADNRIHKVNEIIYIPEAKGIKLPDGSLHEGYFIVRDTGGAFKGIGAQRIDLFVGTDPDYDNAFKKAGFHHKRPMDALKIEGESAQRVRERLKQRFGNLY